MNDFWYCSVSVADGLERLEAALVAAREADDFEAVACIKNDIATLKDEAKPFDKEWFNDL